MKDYYDTSINPRDLSSRLNRIQTSNSLPNNGDAVSRLPRMSRTGTTSSITSSDTYISRLPTFSKSSTWSTTGTNEVSRLEVQRTVPMSPRVQRESVEVGTGEFSKPRAGERRRRESNQSSKTVPEFQYYGRHANSWLFNDFSITDSVKKGWGKVFPGRSGTL